MATGNPGHPSVPGRPASIPFATGPPPAMSPFMSPGPIAGRPDGFGVRPPPQSTPTSTNAFSSPGPMAGPPHPGFKPSPPVGFTDPSISAPPGPPPTHVPSTTNHFQQFPPQFQGPPTNPPIRPQILKLWEEKGELVKVNYE